MEGVSFATYGLKNALSIQSNAVNQLMAGAASVQSIAPSGDNNLLRIEVMKQNGIGQHLNIIT
ncbi:hypothetical protein K9U34_04900 [Lawsonia intracellularis]|uniref:hypothetical protein n=1 Tax=Lawsonia intracellularis TaxID=29546 RepID=UPI0002F9EB93|nr:hypothetical protein [Lawsonia intracellularis]KAA0204500.1 hypothetical protein C4K43_05860 [Lawsonia intracellularis]MBZ3892930.1 hypothetical protein [Lawsonia intracellularis]OMQ02290.1 hypothetical protein BW722_05700 [Lawsonia intracellularis]RBN32915.1 hypothetical protein DR194_00520 [Lawsonia intracellularis]RBN35263.1 hypothetical protein DR192_02735 [Lawsonia intracellularis]